MEFSKNLGMIFLKYLTDGRENQRLMSDKY